MNNPTQYTEKRKHKASRYGTKDYHSDVINKRPKYNKPSPETTATSNSQSSITSFLVSNSHSNEQSLQLKNEEYFKVPPSKKGFNILSLRRSFYSIKTKPNIVGLIKKNVLNNNIVKWTVQSKIATRPTRTSLSTLERNRTAVVPPIVNEAHTDSIISRNYHRLYIEDYIVLNVGDCIKVLIPEKAMKKKNKVHSFDTKFLSILSEIDDATMTQIGGPTNRFFVLSCIIKSCPNRTLAINGIDRVTFQLGYNGNQNYGCLLSVEDSNIEPLLKWRDVINGRREGLQVSTLDCINQDVLQYKNYNLNTFI